MRTVHKYSLDITDAQAVPMPKGAKVVHVGEQRGVLCLWAEVDTDRPKEDRHFVIVGTGNPRPKDAKTHLGSAVVGPFVWHVYE